MGKAKMRCWAQVEVEHVNPALKHCAWGDGDKGESSHELRSPGLGNDEGPEIRQLGRPKAQIGPPRWKLAPGTS